MMRLMSFRREPGGHVWGSPKRWIENAMQAWLMSHKGLDWVGVPVESQEEVFSSSVLLVPWTGGWRRMCSEVLGWPARQLMDDSIPRQACLRRPKNSSCSLFVATVTSEFGASHDNLSPSAVL